MAILNMLDHLHQTFSHRSVRALAIRSNTHMYQSNLQFRALLKAAGFVGIIVEKRETERMEEKSKVAICYLLVHGWKGAEKGCLKSQYGKIWFQKGDTGKMWSKIMVQICDDKLNYVTSVIIRVAECQSFYTEQNLQAKFYPKENT